METGRPKEPKGFKPDDDVIKLKSCPDCQGRGWFLINPFAMGGGDGSGGIGNKTQCLTCLNSHTYYQAHGKLPDDVVARIEANATKEP